METLFWMCVAGCIFCSLLMGTFQMWLHPTTTSSSRLEMGLSESRIKADYDQQTDGQTNYLVHIFRSIPPSTSGSHQTVSNVYRRARTIPYDYVTLVTQLSLNKFDRLAQLASRWNGPISCAVYIPDEESIARLDGIMKQQTKLFHDFVAIHVLLERQPLNSEYPVNKMRNLALFNAETELFFYDDVDFMTPSNAHDYLYDYFVHKRSSDKDRYKKLYVLPAFEVFKMDGGAMVNDLIDVPETKEGLMERLTGETIQPFHSSYFPDGHVYSTDFPRWYSCHSHSGSYPVTDYNYLFEPYVVGYVHGVHYFDERLRGFGRNKITWIQEAYGRGYDFEVLCDVFVVHMNHPGRENRQWNHETREIVYWYDETYWKEKYGDRLDPPYTFEPAEAEELVDEYEIFENTKQLHDDCHAEHDSTITCFPLAINYIDAAVVLVSRGQISVVIGDGRQLDYLLEVEAVADEYSAANLDQSRELSGHLLDLYLSSALVQRNRGALSQAASYALKALKIDPERNSAQDLLREMPEDVNALAIVEKKNRNDVERLASLEIEKSARMPLPNVLLMGVQQAGVAQISDWLIQDYEGRSYGLLYGICSGKASNDEPPFYQRESHFFDNQARYSAGFEFYARRFKHCPKYDIRARRALIVDATPDYWTFPERVHEFYSQEGPDENLKLIIVLRDPATREVERYSNMVEKFEATGETDELNSVVASPNIKGKAMLLDRYIDTVLLSNVTAIDHYADHLSRWIDMFGREKLLILNYDELVSDKDKVQDMVREFLGVNVPQDFEMKSLSCRHTLINATAGEHEKLDRLYREKNEELYELLGANPSPLGHAFPRFQAFDHKRLNLC